jgi:hypothetical protein
MNPHFTILPTHIIGQTLLTPLAGIRSPAGLPESVSSTLFETHFLVWGICIIVAFILTRMGARRRQRSLAKAGFIIMMTTMLWMIAAYAVDTPAERLSAAHQRLLTAAQNKDIAGIKALLVPTFRFGPLDRDELASAVDASLKTFTIKSNVIRKYSSAVNDTHAGSEINVLSTLDGSAAGTYLTKWELEWEDNAEDGWRLGRIVKWYLNDHEMPASEGFPHAP